ncbi:MAG: hypothetical protein IJ325_09410 [Clostridia bacterium]|nr:hypothetical protein [Clostridia bacterium]
MKPIKISIIGAGSAIFSISTIKGICSSDILPHCTISLMDINEEKLDAIYTIATRFNEEIGGTVTFEKTTDRAVSLKDADYVLTLALTASYSHMRDGFAIAEKYGFRYGGSYHILYDEAFWINFYQFRFFEELTQDMIKYCPNAWHLLMANPVISGVTLLQRKYPQIKMIGLCHGYTMVDLLAKDLGCKPEDITYQIPGVNHFVFLNRGHIKGESIFPILDKWIDECSEEVWKTGSWALKKMRVFFYQTHGVYPIGDTLSWSGASWPWWYHTEEDHDRYYEVGETLPHDQWQALFEDNVNTFQHYIDVANDTSRKMTEMIGGKGSDGNDMVSIVESMTCDIPKVFIVNVLNKGQLVPGIPEDFEVEVPALISANGVHPMQTDPLPKPVIAHTLRDRVAPVEMELAAYENSSLEYLKELVLMDKWSTSMTQVEQFLDEILDLPCHEEMRKHYR